MKKLTKFLAVILACITVFSTASLAAEGTLPNEETTTLTQEETTLPAEEETTLPAEEETTAPAEEETTAPAEEETTLPAEEETTAPAEEETTAPAEEETTAPAEEETTAPEEETTEPEKPEIVLPKAPENLRKTGNGQKCEIFIGWDRVEGVDGYETYVKSNGEWVLVETSIIPHATVSDLLYYNEYEVGVKSFIEVDGVKYYSENYSTAIFKTMDYIPNVFWDTESTKDGIEISWHETEGVSGYRLYIRIDGKWQKITDIKGRQAGKYIYKNVKAGETYTFGIKAFVKGTGGTTFGSLDTEKIKHEDFTKSKITSKSATSSSVTLKWSKVEGAGGYRVYVYKNNKWTYYKGIKTEKYTVKSLEDATNYKFKVRAFFKENGETIWGTYSDTVTVRTDGKSVKSGRISKLKKQFTDGDWSVKLGSVVFDGNEKVDLTIAVKGNNLFVRYDFKNAKETDIEYLVQLDKERVYMINKKNKTYCLLPDDIAAYTAANLLVLPLVMDLSEAKGVTAKTTIYKSKKAVAEIYTDKELGIKKTYYFINDKLSGLKVVYADGSTESFSSIKVNDTPTSSVFKVPSGYKKVAYK